MGWAAAKGVLQRQATGWVVVVVGSSRSGGGGRRGGSAAPVHTRRAWTARESGTTWYAERRKRRAGGGSPVLFAVETNARFGSAAAVTRAVTSFACGWWLEHRSTGAEEGAGARGLWARQAARERYVLEKAATWDQAGERAAAISVGGVRLGSRSELPDQPTGTMCLTKPATNRDNNSSPSWSNATSAGDVEQCSEGTPPIGRGARRVRGARGHDNGGARPPAPFSYVG